MLIIEMNSLGRIDVRRHGPHNSAQQGNPPLCASLRYSKIQDGIICPSRKHMLLPCALIGIREFTSGGVSINCRRLENWFNVELYYSLPMTLYNANSFTSYSKRLPTSLLIYPTPANPLTGSRLQKMSFE